ncbi:MAG: hypothetical protein ACD_46C00195G0005 [uncultured bacterium]|nr:MAG: hypothetical protein ACD_46C00195G0005 [uncultured bacterium]
MVNTIKEIVKFIWLNKYSLIMFLIVGGVTTVSYFLIFAFLWNVLLINYRIAVSIAYILSLAVHFTANRNLTFKSKHDIKHQIPKYLLMALFNYVMTIISVTSIVEIFQCSPYIGIVFSICINIITTYLMSYFWVFKSELSHT